MRWYTGEELVPFLRGAPFVEVADGRVKVSRLDPANYLSYPIGAWQHAQSTAGVRLDFATSADGIRFNAWDPGHEPEEDGLISLWENAICLATHDQRACDGEVRAEFSLPKEGYRTYSLHLPFLSRLEPMALGVPDGEELSPVEPAPYVWAAYGDSITQGRTASDPGYSYVAQTAYYSGLEPLNLGFRGWARGEPAAAHMLAEMDFDILSIFMGVNVRVSSWLDAAAWRETFRNFIELVRLGHPTTPILVISILSCQGEFRDSAPDARGVTMAALREVEHDVVAQRQADGDRHIRLIDGTSIIGPEDSSKISDGTHPNDLGMNRIATHIAPVLREMLGLAPLA